MATPAGYLQPVVDSPGTFYPNPTMEPTGEGNFFPGDLIPYDATSYLVIQFDPTTPSLTYLPPTAGYGPGVEVVVTDAPPIAVTGTVWRFSQGRKAKVRGGVRRPLAGGFAVPDYEVAKGTPVTFVTEIFDADGKSLGFLASETITLDRSVMGVDYDKVFVHNVLAPSRSLVYQPLRGAFGEQIRTTPGGTYTPEGQALPLWMGGRRSGLQNINLSGYTATVEDSELLDSMLGNSSYIEDDGTVPILCFRAPPLYRMPATLICVVEESTAVLHTNSQSGTGRSWQLVGTEVEPPFPGIAEPVVTWDDVAVRYPTRAQVSAAYLTLLDVSRDYSLAGLASS